ncbi:MAG: class I SAM-dependent methyltransferase [Verrucomicrobiae bacterium]|nr:class I SAM-dependent methyltransferase [Verrucomicrobiae bacterium]
MAAPVQIDWYDTPLYYDIIFDEDTGREADFLEAVFARHGRTRGRAVLEPACGSGRLVREMAARGWTTDGFDLNPAMLEFARRRLEADGLSANLWSDRMECFRTKGRRRYDLVHCLVSTFKYLLSEEDALGCLKGTALALKPGGLFVLGLHLTDPACKRPSHERWTARRDGIEVTCNTRTWPPLPRTRLEPMRSRLRVSLPDGSLREQETKWEVRSYTASQLRKLLRKCDDFEVLACHDFRHDPAEIRSFDDEYSDLTLVLGRK